MRQIFLKFSESIAAAPEAVGRSWRGRVRAARRAVRRRKSRPRPWCPRRGRSRRRPAKLRLPDCRWATG